MLHLYRSAVRELPAAVWWYSAALFVNRAGSMVLPFLGLYLRDAVGLDTTQVSWILAAYGLGSLVGVWVSGSLVDRYGGHRIQILSLALGGAAFLAAVGLRSFTSFVVGSFVMAGLSDMVRPASMASVTAATVPENRARAFALMRLAVNAGMAVGPMLGGLLAEYDFRLIFVGDGVTCILAAIVLAVVPLANTRPGTPRTDNTRSPARATDAERPGAERPQPALGPNLALRDRAFLAYLGLLVLFGTSFFQLFCTLPLHMKDSFGWSERDVGLLIGINALLIVIFELPLVDALEKRRPIGVMAVGSGLVAVGFTAFLFGAHPVIPFVMIVLVTFGEMLVFPASNVVVANRAPSAQVGRYMALYGFSMSSGFMLAPWIGLQAYARSGGTLVWGAAAAASAVTAIIAVVVVGPILATDPRTEAR